MEINNILTAAMIFGILILGVGLVTAQDLPTRGPIPFSSWDTDGNGTIDEAEFNSIREQRQEMAKSGGYKQKNMATAPTFAQIDKDNNSKITPEELMAVQKGQRWNN
jgi:hypothetical protein